MEKVKVSVIVPVYGVEAYLEKCLDTLVNQTLKEIEIIVINDSSPDNSQKIIDKYAKKYNNIKAFKKPNGGLSDTRNFGIEKATGEYIAFLDSDDYVREDMYEKMYKKAKDGNFDVVVCDLNYVYENSADVKRAYSNIKTDTTNIKDAMLRIYPAAWNKIFKKKLFNNTDMRFKKGVWFEDVEFIYRALPYIKSIGVVAEPFHQYLQRKGSITKSVDPRIYHYIDNWNGVIDYYKENNLYDEYKKELEYSYVRYIYATFIKQATHFPKDEYSIAVEKAIQNVKEHFPKYRRNKYFYKSLKGLYLLTFNKLTAKLVYCLKKNK